MKCTGGFCMTWYTDNMVGGTSMWNPFSYRGRVARLRYLCSILAITASFAIIGFLFVFVFFSSLSFAIIAVANGHGLGTQLLVLATVGCMLAVLSQVIIASFIVRRFHDLGKSGLWWFALLIPIYNIHLGIGLLAEQGTAGMNKYGADPLPLNAVRGDVIHRFSQNKVARIVALIVLLALSGWSLADTIHQRVIQQQQLNTLINQAVRQAAGNSNALPATSSPTVQQQNVNQLINQAVQAAETDCPNNTTSSAYCFSFTTRPVAQKPPFNVSDTTAWKSIERNDYLGYIYNFDTSSWYKASACYTMKYPSLEYYPAPSYNGYFFKTSPRFASGTPYVGGDQWAQAIIIDSHPDNATDSEEGVLFGNDMQWLAYDTLNRPYQNISQKDFYTAGGIRGVEAVGADGFWFIELPLPAPPDDPYLNSYILSIHPATPMNDSAVKNIFYDATFGEAMAKSIVPMSSCTH